MKGWSLASAGALAAAVLVGGAVTGAGVAHAATTTPQQLYVSASATSDPACAVASQANPFRTIAGALGCARNGATVNIGAGQFAGEVTVPVNVTLVGAGAGTVIADPGVAADLVPELRVAAGRTVTVRNLQINGADAAGNQAHGGIRSAAGTLTVQGVDITNTLSQNGAGVDAESGAGDVHVTVRNSTISNTLALQNGGGIAVVPSGPSTATLSVLNSTISGNQANGNGGGLALYARTTTTVRESTIAGNDGFDGGGIFLQPEVGHTATLTGTLLAANTAFDASSGPDCLATAGAGVNVISGGGNLIGQDTGANGTGCAGFSNAVNGDQVGTAGAPIDPVLGPLANNGGLTPTRALLSGSPAIGTGNATDCQTAPISNLDQRGLSRRTPTRATCDIGAYDTEGISLQTLYVRHWVKSDQVYPINGVTGHDRFSWWCWERYGLRR
jgi:parallel beta-helix repeat protein